MQVKLEVPDYELGGGGGGGCELFDPVGGTAQTQNQNGVKEEVVDDDKDADDGAPPKRRRKRRRARISMAESSKCVPEIEAIPR